MGIYTDDVTIAETLNEATAQPLASAGTVAIGYADGNTIHITGTTTITSFGAATQAGVRRIVIFDGALTLTHGANLVLPGAANITTAAGDIGTFVADTATKWRCVNYQTADRSSAGSLSGSFDGNATIDSLTLIPQALVADGAITSNYATLDATAATVNATLASLAAGKLHVFTCLDATSVVTVTLTIGTFDGTNNKATFDAAYDCLVVLGLDGTQGVIILNSGTVALSAV